jgi:hypothetical protein
MLELREYQINIANQGFEILRTKGISKQLVNKYLKDVQP